MITELPLLYEQNCGSYNVVRRTHQQCFKGYTISKVILYEDSNGHKKDKKN